MVEMLPLSRALALGTIAGRFEIRLVGTLARFLVGERRLSRVQVPQSGGVIGRHPLAEIVLSSEASKVSRAHLAAAPLGLGWHVWDCGSANGTTLMLADGRRRPLIPWVPVPVAHESRLELASSVVLVAVIDAPPGGGMTPTSGAQMISVIPDPELEEAARAFLSPRRFDPASSRVLGASELASMLNCSSGTAYNRLRALSNLAPVAARMSATGPLDRGKLSDALAAAYPYLLLEVPGGS